MSEIVLIMSTCPYDVSFYSQIIKKPGDTNASNTNGQYFRRRNSSQSLQTKMVVDCYQYENKITARKNCRKYHSTKGQVRPSRTKPRRSVRRTQTLMEVIVSKSVEAELPATFGLFLFLFVSSVFEIFMYETKLLGHVYTRQNCTVAI